MKSIAIEPVWSPSVARSIEESGGAAVRISSKVEALIWTDYSQPDLLAKTLAENPQLTWVQLPWAGVDAFGDIIRMQPRFTCAKGAYAEPVAEHALALCLALGRAIPDRVRARSWGKSFAKSLYDSKFVIIGAGGITASLLEQLAPFRVSATVVRNSNEPMPGAGRTLQLSDLGSALPEADFVVIAASLTAETRGVINSETLALMKPTSYLVNIARGGHVVLDDLLDALNRGVIAGAALDVTDPEPLPDGQPAWDASKLIITPHTADTPEQVQPLFARRVAQNTRAYLGTGPWVGEVSKTLGY
jgi:phosphoglycerate dehydrogenase-like enzyme